MIFVYPLGVPAYYALTLFRNKAELATIRQIELSITNEVRVPAGSPLRERVALTSALVLVPFRLQENRSKLGSFLKGKELREYQPEIDEAEARKAELESKYEEQRGNLPGALKKLTNGYEMRTYW